MTTMDVNNETNVMINRIDGDDDEDEVDNYNDDDDEDDKGLPSMAKGLSKPRPARW